MDEIQNFRDRQLRSFTNEVGVYALCDLDNIPIYIGQSTDGIRSRVRRHLTSARSDIIANKLLDVWEVAFVWAWPMPGSKKDAIDSLENHLVSTYNNENPLFNGIIPMAGNLPPEIPEIKSIQILPTEQIDIRKNSIYRLPRQINQFHSLFEHILEIKNNPEMRRTLKAHFVRMRKYYEDFMRDNNDPDF